MDSPKKKIIKPAVLAGFRDILPAVALRKEDMTDCVKSVFRSYGYCPIETPHLEYTEMLIGSSSNEIKKQLYRFHDNGERDVTLRFDHTVPLARFISQHRNTLGLPFKRYAIGSVFRGESPQAGRYREFTQCDFDYIGTRSIAADAEIVQVIVHALSALKLDDFTVRVNHRSILSGLAIFYGLEDQVDGLLRIIDKLDKMPAEKIQALLKYDLDISEDTGAEILRFIALDKNTPDDTDWQTSLESQKAYQHPLIQEGITELRKFKHILEKAGIGGKNIRVDLSIARGLDYYTGIVYETILNNCPNIGSVASGGRYDNLTGCFSKDAMPGVGASIGLDRLIAGMNQLKMLPTGNTPARVLIGNLDERYIPDSFGLANKLRRAGISTEVYPSAERISKLFSFAEHKGFKFMIAYGENEAKEDTFIIADLTGGKKTPVNSSDRLTAELLTLLG